MSLLAGAAKQDISPRKPTFLVGYPHVERTSTGIHDPLWANALCLANGDQTVILIGLDILFIPHAVDKRCREQIAQNTGVPAENILISASHTHSGPVTRDMLAWRNDPMVPNPDPEYMQHFAAGIIEAAREAHGKMAPAELAVTSAQAQGVGGNRLAEDGVRDPEVGILYVRARDTHAPLAADITYSMHPTVLHEDTKLVSADFPGYTKQMLERELPGLVPVYHMGPSGNQSPRYHVSGQTFEEAERLGNRLAEAVLEAIDALDDADFSSDPEIAAAAAGVSLPRRRFLAVNEARENLRKAVARYEQLKQDKAGHGPVRTAECAVFGAEEAVALAEAQESGDLDHWYGQYRDVEVRVLRIGSVCMAGLPGELFVEYGLEIKRRAAQRTFVASLAGGELQGYIVTPEADRAGGYEAACSFFKPEAGALMVDRAVALVQQLSQQRGRQ